MFKLRRALMNLKFINAYKLLFQCQTLKYQLPDMCVTPPLGGLRVAFFLMFAMLAISTNSYASMEDLITINETESGSLLIETDQIGQYLCQDTKESTDYHESLRRLSKIAEFNL